MKKGLKINDDTFNFLMHNRFFIFKKDELSNFFDTKISFTDCYNKYNFYYVKKKLDHDYEQITQSLLKNNKDSNFRKVLNKSNLYLLNLSINSLIKDENKELLDYINDYIYKFENSFEERSKALNVKAFGSITDAKLLAIKDVKNTKYFESFYWIGENGSKLENKVNKIDVEPLYIDELSPTEQKKMRTYMEKFYGKNEKKFEFQDSKCFIFKVDKYQVLKYYLNMFNIVYSVQSIPLKIQKRIKDFSSDESVPLWVKSFTIFQRSENMVIFFYIPDSNEKTENVFEELASKIIYDACTFKYNVARENAFSLQNFEDFQENKLMKIDLVKKEVKSNVKKF